MKTAFQFFAIVFFAILISGCSKNPDVPVTAEEQVAKLLTGGSNRVWRLQQLFVKGVLQALTGDQAKYTKTFTVEPSQKFRGGYTDADGNFGDWFVNSVTGFTLNFTTAGGNQYSVIYLIRNINATDLDIQYTLNGETIREVYNAY